MKTNGQTTDLSTLLCTLQGVEVRQEQDGRVHFVADADIDADGGYHAYHPDNKSGLDDLRNAGQPGNWYGIVTDARGRPIVQQIGDPAPGFYVSPTSYEWPQFPKDNPRRYVNAETVPFIVVEGFIRRRAKGIVLGCKARVTDTRTGRSVDAVVADMGPLLKIGELSVSAAVALGIPSSPRTGGISQHVIAYELWPGVPAVVNGVTYRLLPA